MKKNLFYNLTLTVVSFVCILSMYLFPQVTKCAVRDSLEICGKALIPSLFPFITATRLFSAFFRKFSTSMAENGHRKGRLNTVSLLFTGWLSGFPAGAFIAGEMYSGGSITKQEAERITAFSNCISPSFCILYFGDYILSDVYCGIIVFCAVLSANLILYFLSGRYLGKPETMHKSRNNKADSAADSITSIIADCSIVMLNICAFVTFFNCIGRLLAVILSCVFPLSNEVKAIIYGLFEVSSGTNALKILPFGTRFMLGSVFMGFGGISAILQVIYVCKKHNISANNFIAVRFLCAILVPLISSVLIFLLPYSADLKILFRQLFSEISKNKITMFIIFGIAAAVFISLFVIIKRKEYKKSTVYF